MPWCATDVPAKRDFVGNSLAIAEGKVLVAGACVGRRER